MISLFILKMELSSSFSQFLGHLVHHHPNDPSSSDATARELVHQMSLGSFFLNPPRRSRPGMANSGHGRSGHRHCFVRLAPLWFPPLASCALPPAPLSLCCPSYYRSHLQSSRHEASPSLRLPNSLFFSILLRLRRLYSVGFSYFSSIIAAGDVTTQKKKRKV